MHLKKHLFYIFLGLLALGLFYFYAISSFFHAKQVARYENLTELGQEYEEAPFPLLSLEEYTDLVADSIRILPEKMVIHRMTGDGPGYLLIAPQWVRNKKKVLNMIHRKL